MSFFPSSIKSNMISLKVLRNSHEVVLEALIKSIVTKSLVGARDDFMAMIQAGKNKLQQIPNFVNGAIRGDEAFFSLGNFLRSCDDQWMNVIRADTDKVTQSAFLKWPEDNTQLLIRSVLTERDV